MDFARPQYLVESDWLAQHLEDPGVRVLECTVYLHPADVPGGYRVESGRAKWAEGHIPGAGFVDLPDELSDRSSKLRFMMPPAAQFAEAMGRAGVGDGVRVILYDRAVNMWAARICARPALMADRAGVLAALGESSACVLNALSEEQHRGTGGTSYGGRPGRITGSVNVVARDLVDPRTHAYLPADVLRAKFEAVGALDAKRVVTYCGAGIAASSDAFVLTLLGRDDVAVYDASLSEWANDPTMPMERG